MIVVSDTSPVLNLALVHRLDLLVSLYGQVLIPRAVYAVYEELTRSDTDPPLIDAVSSPWLVVVSANDQDRVPQLEAELDRGEAEAIVLAIERRADLLLIDERRARRIALTLGLRITGLVGVLAEAKGSGLIEWAKPILDDLIQRAGFWIGADLYDQVLTELNER